MKKEECVVRDLRCLACSTIHNAGSGHIGICLGAAPIIYSIFKNLNISSKEPNFYNRDRFVMCAGHGGVLDYCMRYMLGYDITKDDLKNYRKHNAKLTAFPTRNEQLGIDATTGPLGQGFAMAVGMAIAESFLSNRFNKKDARLVNHYTYCFISDGCLMEGITNEAASLAGNLKLNKLIVLYDCNNKTIDGDLKLSFSENIKLKFEAMGWNAVEIKNGEDLSAINKAIQQGKKSDKPTIIKVNTKIGKYSPLENDSKCHASSLTEEEFNKTLKRLNVKNEDFELSVKTELFLKKIKRIKESNFKTELKMQERYEQLYPSDYEEFLKWNENFYSKKIIEKIKKNKKFLNIKDFSNKNNNFSSTKDDFSYIFKKVAKEIPNLISVSADIFSRAGNFVDDGGIFSYKYRLGRNLFCGVREHSMAGICNGIALHGGLRVVCSSYMCFSDYMKPAIRMSAIMKLNVVFVLINDSVLIGDDGVTHQPIEHNAMYRSIPNLNFIRPADFNETVGSIVSAFTDEMPTVIALTKQKVSNNFSTKIDIEKGGYFVEKHQTAKVNLIGTGSEVGFCFLVSEELKKIKIETNIISVPCVNKFEKFLRSSGSVFDHQKYNFVFELSSDLSLNRFTNNGKFFGVNFFLKGGCENDVENDVDYDPKKISIIIKKSLKNNFQ